MQALGRALRTCMNRAREGKRKAPFMTCSSADVLLVQQSLPLVTRTSLVHAWRATTIRLVRRRRLRLAATLAAGGPFPQRSSVIMFEDNSRFHSSCASADRPSAARAPVLSGCTADPPVRETCSNFENIVRD